MGNCALHPGVNASLDDAFGDGADAAGTTKMILVTDPGQDLDDEMTFIMLRHLYELNLVRVEGIVTTLTPAFDRARLTRGTLDVLGLFGVPIGVGSDGGDAAGKHKADTFVEWARPYMVPRFSAASDAFSPGQALLHELYAKAAPRSLTLVVIAAMKDPALFLRDAERLFQEKTAEVVIMGGVEAWDESDGKEPVLLRPDTANNNTFCMESAKFFYRRCQELGIPIVVVSRWAAYAAKVPRTCYDELASTGSWIGCRLRNAQRASIENLWSRAASPAGSEARQHLPDRCDKSWFLKTFCAGADGSSRSASDTIWDLIVGFMQYDAVATVAAIPSLRQRFFSPVSVKGLNNTVHSVIGRSEQVHNIKNVDSLAEFLKTGFKKGLAYNHKRKKQFFLLLQPRWSNIAENLFAFVAIRGLLDHGTFDCAGVILHDVPNGPGDESMREFASTIREFVATLGLSHIPVLVAGHGGKSGCDHLDELYSLATPAGVSLVATGTLDVIADFAEKHSKAFVSKTQNVVLVGGARVVDEIDDLGKRTGDKTLEPDPAAQNNSLALDAAKRFYIIAERLLIPLIVVTRHFVQGVQVPRSFYDILGNETLCGPIGRKLYDLQRQSVAQLWKAVVSPIENVKSRRSLPERCDRKWFVNSFCSGNVPDSDSLDDVWKAVSTVNVYNLQAILLAFPPVFNRFVKGSTLTVRSVRHLVLGSPEDSGHLDATSLRNLILQSVISGTRLNSALFELEPPSIPELDWKYNTARDALDWLIPPEILAAKKYPTSRQAATEEVVKDYWAAPL
eukprot:TRINITY_DN255_c0_g6_i1.p1 TRINITY_DN255_c0_g6~~TRINITY_DN255_c0_g6_i1.p1  ORF type:complete len:812 (+),score=134.33 TRINITY_DN255_c0_g6_i1:65-2437(+)